MRTDDLIAALAADKMRRPPVAALVTRWFLPVLLLAGVITLSMLGLRPDLAAAMAAPVTAMKPILPLVVGVAAGCAVLRRADPARDAGWLIWPIALVAGLAGLWLLATLAATPVAEWWVTAKGQTLGFCLVAIPVIAGLPLIVLIMALRSGASTAPMRSGALAGLASGAGAAAIYAMHCTEDSPLFFLSWYTLGILVMTALGALAGRRFLRW